MGLEGSEGGPCDTPRMAWRIPGGGHSTRPACVLRCTKGWVRPGEGGARRDTRLKLHVVRAWGACAWGGDGVCISDLGAAGYCRAVQRAPGCGTSPHSVAERNTLGTESRAATRRQQYHLVRAAYSDLQHGVSVPGDLCWHCWSHPPHCATPIRIRDPHCPLA